MTRALALILAAWIAIIPSLALADGIAVPGVPQIGSGAAFSYPPSTGGGGNLTAIDGAAQNSNTATSITVTLTTTQSNDVIIVDVATNSGVINSVSSPNLGTLTSHATTTTGALLTRYYAIAASPLSSEVITVSISGSNYVAATAYGISGANTASPFDAGGPVVTSTSPADPKSITTVNAKTMVIGAFRMASTSTPTAGSGFTNIVPGNPYYVLSEYEKISTAQTLSVTIGTGSGDSNGSIIDAIKSL